MKIEKNEVLKIVANLNDKGKDQFEEVLETIKRYYLEGYREGLERGRELERKPKEEVKYILKERG